MFLYVFFLMCKKLNNFNVVAVVDSDFIIGFRWIRIILARGFFIYLMHCSWCSLIRI